MMRAHPSVTDVHVETSTAKALAVGGNEHSASDWGPRMTGMVASELEYMRRAGCAVHDILSLLEGNQRLLRTLEVFAGNRLIQGAKAGRRGRQRWGGNGGESDNMEGKSNQLFDEITPSHEIAGKATFTGMPFQYSGTPWDFNLAKDAQRCLPKPKDAKTVWGGAEMREGPEWRRRATSGRPEVRGSTRGGLEMNRKTGNGPEIRGTTGGGPEVDRKEDRSMKRMSGGLA
ncbi:hypothetical protein B0H10DRAFT_1953165 [Mycena sp. CBHHK59/15]|nr:hypothetical protein B0H10DRAFT_1953165 [Mycena sp. CBHHK59/15]